MLKRKFVCLTALLLSLMISACSGPVTGGGEAQLSPEPTALTFTDGLGRSVTLSVTPQRIVSLAPSNTEVLYALGASEQLVGRDEFSDYPPEAKSVPSVGGSLGQYDLESIAALKPDLVLAAELNTPEQVKALEDLGLKVYYLPNPTDLEGMYANLTTIGQITGHTQEADELVVSLRQRVEAVSSRLAGVTTRPVVYYELDASDASKPYTAGPGTFIDSLIQVAGGENAAAGLGAAWAQISLEQVLVANPDVILLGDAAYGVTPESVAARPGWSEIRAVKGGKVYPFDDNLVSRPTPRLVDGLEALAEILHP